MRRHRTKLAVLALFLAASLFSFTSPASAVSAGQKCKKAGLTATSKSGGKTVVLTCTKVGKKLLWVKMPTRTTTTVSVTTTTTVPNCLQSGPCVVGSKGPGGGIVFYVATTPFTATGTTCNTACLYLEAAPNTWNGSRADPSSNWATRYVGCYDASDALTMCIGGSIYPAASAAASRIAATAIGMGMANTNAIVARHVGVDTSTYAAGMADALTFGGQSDWFLPSTDELNAMYTQKSAVGGFDTWYYTSSSESIAHIFRVQHFDDGFHNIVAKSGGVKVRPIRAF